MKGVVASASTLCTCMQFVKVLFGFLDSGSKLFSCYGCAALYSSIALLERLRLPWPVEVAAVLRSGDSRGQKVFAGGNTDR